MTHTPQLVCYFSDPPAWRPRVRLRDDPREPRRVGAIRRTQVEAAADRPRPGDRGRPGLPGLQVLAAKEGGEWETRHREACSGLRC